MKSLVQHISQLKTLHSLNEFIQEEFKFRIGGNSAKNRYSPKTNEELKQIIQDHYDAGVYNLNDIDVSKITDFSKLFFEDENTDNTEFDVSEWNVSNGKNFSNMFDGCKEFNCDISRWDVNNGSYFTGMFCNCEKFNADLSNWDVSNGKNFVIMFRDCPIKQEFKPKHENIY